MPGTRDYIAIANQYVDGVQSGIIPACKWVKLAVSRHVEDLKKARKKDYPFVFDEAAAIRPCKFIELLKHIKGEWAGTTITLEPWQCFILTTLFGWVCKETGFRRFRTSYQEVPRKNAKSTISAGLSLFMLTSDNEGGAECYTAATTKKQAEIVFNDAKRMATRATDLQDKFKMNVYSKQVLAIGGENVLEPVSSEAKNLDGLNPHFASVDELHAHKTRAVYDVIETAMGARRQSLLSVITTAGFDVRGICYELHDYGKKVLEGIFDDDSFFCIIYTIDEGDDPFSEASWQKANPNWNVSVKPDYVASLARKAKRTLSAQANFKTKHLNVWCKSDTQWLNMDWWSRCGNTIIQLDDFKDVPCWIGLDLASKIDVAALVMLFQRDDEFYIKPKFYLPHESVEERADSTYQQYSSWATAGYFTLTPGEIIDFDYIEEDILNLHNTMNVLEVGYDPHQATQLATRLDKKGVEMVEVRPLVLNFSEPMKHLEALIKSNQIHHDDNPVMSWMMSNVVGHYDKKDNIYPNKERPENKIDGPVALIIAIARAIFAESGQQESVYETRGIEVL